MAESLWGEEFVIPDTQSEVKKAKKRLGKNDNPSGNILSMGSVYALQDKLKQIEKNVLRILGRFKENTVVIRTKDELHNYISCAIDNGIIAIDTETNNSLEPITCKLMGPCIYTPGQKNAYIPINHVDLISRKRLGWQLTEEDVREEFSRLLDTKIIMHNAKFDYQVIKCTTGYELEVYWDTLIGTRILNENERSAKLKEQYHQKIDPTMEKYDIEHLFEGLEYAIVDPDLFALYAATDAFMTYELYLWQLKQFNVPGMDKLFHLMVEVEMPVMRVAADMELTGVEIDQAYAKRLSDKYHRKLDSVKAKIDEQLKKYEDKISEWRLTDDANLKVKNNKPNKNGEYTYKKSKSEQLKSPPEIGSPSQLAILLYDVLGIEAVDKDSPRGTGEDILKKIDNPLCSLIIEMRGIEKLLGTYIDKLPTCVTEKTGRLHAHFNQMGTETGRFSSSDPNLQNIPSKEKSIRMMFKATDGYMLVGSDFSQQEPRLLSGYSQDENMINAYKQGKDLYATIASRIYHNEYRMNLEYETNPDGTPVLDDNGDTILFTEGKKRRGSVKALMLGIMYGMGPSSLAESMKGTIQDAQKIIDDFYSGFPKVKKWIDETYVFAKENGYVEDMWGRRRRLPDIKLPKFEAEIIGEKNTIDFNPILGTMGIVKKTVSPKVGKYLSLAEKCRTRKELNKLKDDAKKDGVELHDNGGYISRAERQCVNARVQGGAATMSKRAMIKVHSDKILNELGFRLMLAVHDELIGECPKENAEAVANRLCDIMKISALPECTVPFKCDPTIESVWYESDYSAYIKSVYGEQMTEMGKTEEEARQYVYENYCECTKERLDEFLGIS